MKENSLKEILEKEVEENMNNIREKIDKLSRLKIEDLKKKFDNFEVSILEIMMLKQSETISEKQYKSIVGIWKD